MTTPQRQAMVGDSGNGGEVMHQILTNADSGAKMLMSSQVGYKACGEVAPTLIIQYTNDPRSTALTCFLLD